MSDKLASSSSILKTTEKITSKIYQNIFKDNITDSVKLFFKHISFVGLGVFIESIFTFAFHIIGGNVLGPAEYGKFTLIVSIGMFLYVPMFFGISTAMIKYNSEKKEFYRQKEIVSTSFFLTLLLNISWITIYLLDKSLLIKILSISENTLYHAILFSVLYGFFVFTTDILRSLHYVKKFSILRPFFGAILVSGFVVCSTLKANGSFLSMIIPMYLAYLILGIVILAIIYRYIEFTFSADWSKILLKYGMFSMINSISFMVFTNIDKILINKYMLTKFVGIYNAYNLSSIKIINVFVLILVTVLFPMISQYESKKGILNKINKSIPYVAIIGMFFVIISEYIVLNFYGTDYPIDFTLLILFAATAILFLIYEIYLWVLNSVGIKGVQLTMYATFLIAVIDIILNIYLIPKYGLQGAISATGIAYLVGAGFLYKTLQSI